MSLSLAAKQQFLAQVHVAALSVAVDGRGPLSVPIWYDYRPGGRVRIITSPSSRKMAGITAAGRFTLLVDAVSSPLTYVSVEGPVVSVEPSTETEVEALATRYLTGEALDGYLAHVRDVLGEQVTVTMEPLHWLGAQIDL